MSLNSRTVEDVLHTCLDACKMSRKRHREESGPPADKSDAGLSQYTRFTDRISLDVYKQFLHYVPRLVNVVTVSHSCSPRVPLLPPCPLACHVRRPQLAEALPMKGSGISLPLDLASIAARCKGSYYAPRRFAAVRRPSLHVCILAPH